MSVPPYSVVRFRSKYERIRVKRDTNLYVGLGLISDLHNEFSLGINHVLEDILIDTDREGVVNQ